MGLGSPYGSTCPHRSLSIPVWVQGSPWSLRIPVWVWGPSRPRTGFPFQEVLGLAGGDVGHGGEDVGAVRGRALQAVPVVDLPLARLLVHVKLQNGAPRGASTAVRRRSQHALRLTAVPSCTAAPANFPSCSRPRQAPAFPSCSAPHQAPAFPSCLGVHQAPVFPSCCAPHQASAFPSCPGAHQELSITLQASPGLSPPIMP